VKNWARDTAALVRNSLCHRTAHAVFFPPLAKGGLGGVVSAQPITGPSKGRSLRSTPHFFGRLERIQTTIPDVRGTRPHPPWPPLHKGGKGTASTTALIRIIILAASAVLTPVAQADEPAPDDSPLVKLLKSGRVPEARLGAIVDMIGKRGTAGDIEFLFQRATSPDGLSAPLKLKALEALAEAAANRNLRPVKNIDKLASLIRPVSSRSDMSLEKAAARLAALWKLETAADALKALAVSPAVDESLRGEALDALAAIGGRVGRSQIEALTAPAQPPGTRIQAVASLAKLDIDAAAARAAEILATAPSPGRDLKPLLAAFLNRQGGADVLAAAIGRHAVPADSAKLALRAVYALGRADPILVAILSRAAGISAETRPLTPNELNQLVTEVAAHGDPTRGELIFRRADLNCVSCHSLSKAGGDVGPDLSAVGQTSPSDYIINSILNPDQAIKEQYHTLIVQTSEGQVFQGIVTDKDDQRIVLKDATGAPRVVPVASIEDQKPGGSLMPKGLANLMTHTEFVDLVRFLSELGKPGAYAIRTTPTIQRWKVLTPISEALVASIPDKHLFRDQVLKAEPDRWTTSYAKVAGSLPLDELTQQTGGTVLYLQGEIDVSNAGPVRAQLDSADGVRFWIDDKQAPPDTPTLVTTLETGRHTVTLRIDRKARSSHEIKAEVTKPTGSTAEFTVVGGH
jgi:putative heme-binding domain-containing protein